MIRSTDDAEAEDVAPEESEDKFGPTPKDNGRRWAEWPKVLVSSILNGVIRGIIDHLGGSGGKGPL